MKTADLTPGNFYMIYGHVVLLHSVERVERRRGAATLAKVEYVTGRTDRVGLAAIRREASPEIIEERWHKVKEQRAIQRELQRIVDALPVEQFAKEYDACKEAHLKAAQELAAAQSAFDELADRLRPYRNRAERETSV